MNIKILATIVIILLLSTCIIPVSGVFKPQLDNSLNNDSYIPFNDAAFDRKIILYMRIAGFPSFSACIIKDD